MEVRLSCELAEDVYSKSPIVHEFDRLIGDYFGGKDYGIGISRLIIGAICVWPKADGFFKIRKKYTKGEKLLVYDIKLDHKSFSTADQGEIKKMLMEEILSSMSAVREMKIVDFDIDAFERDLHKFRDICLMEGYLGTRT